MTKLSENIKNLHNQGIKKSEIAKILSCNIASVYYHTDCNYKAREKIRYYINPLNSKVKHFLQEDKINHKKISKKITNNAKSLILWKIRNFCTIKGDKMQNNFTVQDVIDKFGNNPKCYLTNNEIDLSKPRTYEFDHIIPRSRGGQNTLDNLGICTKESNRAKHDMTPDELFNLCKIILENNGYQVLKSDV